MVLTLRPDIVKLMVEQLLFEMTNASGCHGDAVFVCGYGRFVVFDRSAETGDWCQACACLLSLWERLGEGAKFESQNRRPDRRFTRGFLAPRRSAMCRARDSFCAFRTPHVVNIRLASCVLTGGNLNVLPKCLSVAGRLADSLFYASGPRNLRAVNI